MSREWALVWVAVAFGFLLRILMAQGALWLDEAWSVVLVRQVRPFVGVLAQIHHDNNHPLNSWWIQLVGTHAPVLVLRSLSIVCSTLTIALAARFAARRGSIAGVATAALFACSPILILIGSEARGYAAVLLVQAWLIDRLDPLRAATRNEPRPLALAAAGLLGTLAHLLFFPTVILIAGWQMFARDADRPLRERIGRTLDRLAPALIASFTVVLVVIGSAYAVQGGLTLGDRIPFSLGGWAGGVEEAVALSLGTIWLAIPLVVLLLFVAPRPSRADLALWLFVGLGLPVAAVLLRLPNAEIARYYLPSVFALLTLAAIRGGLNRIGWLVLAGMLVAMLWQDVSLIGAQRSQPDLPVRIVAAQGGPQATILLASSRLSAPTELAAERLGVPIRTTADCAPSRYLLGDREWGAPAKPRVDRCGAQWQLIASRPASYRDGLGWVLYRRLALASIQGRR